ncbi:MAG: anaerobic sulfite reductase subunit AsrB [Nanoarchaeota archaeon]|nr:anaerobic sulfite reductase subunit AsrB [Nanoarchaeota archaeon]
MKADYLPQSVKVLQKRDESADTFTLRLGMKVDHDPGQFIQVSIPGIGEAPISISSYSKDYLEISIRKVGNVTNALHGVKKGSSLFVRGPYGRGYQMSKLKGKGIVFIGGGCGVAPLKGAIEYVEKNRKDFKEIDLFLGFRSPGDILFTSRHKDWENHFNVHMSVDQIPSKTCYSGNVGFITDTLNKTPIQAKGTVAFICGPPIMMTKSIQLLAAKGFKDTQIYVSEEKLMYCAFGLCCHCMDKGNLTCLDGPVFRYDEIVRSRDGKA